MNPAPMTWESLDWTILERLRAGFLDGSPTKGPYWKSRADLEAYDLTYAERIGWKWDAVLRELRWRAWTPSLRPGGLRLLDWGCGSGVAGRRVIDYLGVAAVAHLDVWDHSPLAVEFATKRAQQDYPDLQVGVWQAAAETPDVLVLSHVLNELSPEAQATLRTLAERTPVVLWVEPGTHEVSRSLQRWRDEFVAGGAHILAPCTHLQPCGLQQPGRERDWCHHFASPPAGVHADRNWVKFSQRAGIDLRSLPYSYLVTERDPKRPPPTAGWSRILGRPEHFKPYARVLSCDASGVAELTVPRRTLPELYKHLEKNRGPLVYRWERNGDQVTGGEPG